MLLYIHTNLIIYLQTAYKNKPKIKSEADSAIPTHINDGTISKRPLKIE